MNNRHTNSTTVILAARTIPREVPHAAKLAVIFALSLVACGPTQASDGDGGFGETGNPEPGDIVCVDKGIPDQVTCWVEWLEVHARVVLQCEVDAAVSALSWGPGYTDDLPGWGAIVCHETSLGTKCLYGESRVLLSETASDVWTPEVDPTIWQYEAVEPPCGGPVGDGDGDPVEGECDYLGCPCSAGGCVTNLVCDLSEHCSPCPPGSPGCACDVNDDCEVGQCYAGQDMDGIGWSICYPADLFQCADGVCPGDAYCTDGLKCAWAD